jgi:hypothetical protein
MFLLWEARSAVLDGLLAVRLNTRGRSYRRLEFQRITAQQTQVDLRMSLGSVHGSWPNLSSSLCRGIIKLFTAREHSVSDIPAGDGKTIAFFYSVRFPDLQSVEETKSRLTLARMTMG